MLSTSTVITAESLPESLRAAASSGHGQTPSFLPLDDLVERYVAQVLEHTGGNHTQAALILGISRRTLHRMAARKRSTPEDEHGDTMSHGDHI